MTGADGSTAQTFAVSIRTDADCDPVLVLSGELDLAGAGQLEAAVAEVAKKRPQRIVFDVAELRFIDSAGIAVLVGASAMAPVCLREPSEAVRRIVQITGLSEILTVASAA